MPNPRAARTAQSTAYSIAFAAFLTRLAKHLALLACFAIIGQATGRAAIGQLSIFFLIVGATLVHIIGTSFKRHRRPSLSDYSGSP